MFISKKSLSRRALLQGTGVSLTLPFLDAMIPAAAAAEKPVKRFAFVYVPNGAVMEKWLPQETGTGFDFSPTLKPLESFRPYTNVISGLYSDGHNDHPPSPAMWLSGSYPASGDQRVLATTIDQLIAREIGSGTTFPSLEMGIEDTSSLVGACGAGNPICSYMNTISWRSPTQPLHMEINPRVIFERMFGSDEATPEARQKRIVKSTSILDSVLDEVNDLNRQLGSTDQLRLGEYLDSVRAVETEIVTGEQQRQTMNLEAPPIPSGVPEQFEDHVRMMFDLQVLAHQGDLTRVTSFMMARELSGITYPQLGFADSHHPVSHHGYVDEMMDKKAIIDRYHVSLFSEFLEKLMAIPDGDGNLLDNSVILYGGGMSDSQVHDHLNLPTLVVGGGAGDLVGNRLIKAGIETQERKRPKVPFFNRMSNLTNLHVSLLQQAGINVEKFGQDANESTGAITLV